MWKKSILILYENNHYMNPYKKNCFFGKMHFFFLLLLFFCLHMRFRHFKKLDFVGLYLYTSLSNIWHHMNFKYNEQVFWARSMYYFFYTVQTQTTADKPFSDRWTWQEHKMLVDLRLITKLNSRVLFVVIMFTKQYVTQWLEKSYMWN